MTGAMLTRLRIEAVGDSEHVVKNMLTSLVSSLDLKSNEWKEEEPGLQIQTSSKGYWGRLTIRRNNDASEVSSN